MLDAAMAQTGIEAWESDQLQAGTATWSEAATSDPAVETSLAPARDVVAIPIGDLANSPPGSLEIDATRVIDENQVVDLLLSFRDSDPFDVHTVEVDWGDGSQEEFNLSVGSRFFGTTHQYLDDDPSVTASDDYQVLVRVTDQRGGSVTGMSNVTVHNVAPSHLTTTPAAAIDENGVASLDLFFHRPRLARSTFRPSRLGRRAN